MPAMPSAALDYERQLDPSLRKSRGVFYTPKVLVDYLVRHTLGSWLENKSPDEIKTLRIYDPACGGGAFLHGALECLATWYREFDPSADAAEIANRHLYGTDIDRQAVRIARRSLGCDNIRVADALSQPLEPAFDVILANPPFLNGVENPHISASLRDRFACARGTIDASILFQELCLRLLRPGGKCGLIVPNKFLSAPFGTAFRKYATQEARLERLADFSQSRLFPDAAVYPVAYVLAKDNTNLPTTIEREEIVRTCHTSPSNLETWDQLFFAGMSLLQRLRQEFLPLRDVCEVAASATATEAYAFRSHLTDDLSTPGFRLVTSGLIDRYAHHHGNKPVRYLKKNFAAPILPLNCPAISANRRRQYASEKLIVSGLSRCLKVIHDHGQLAGAVPTVQILRRDPNINLKAILAILNSKFIDRWFRETFNSLSLSGGYLRIGSPQIGAIPIWPRDRADYDTLQTQLAAAAGGDDDRIEHLVHKWFRVPTSRPRKP